MQYFHKREVAAMNLRRPKPATVFNTLNVLDFTTTYIGVEKAEREEKNPLIRGMVEKGKWKELFAFKVVIIPAFMHLSMKQRNPHEGEEFHQRTVDDAYKLLNAFFGIVVINNTFGIVSNFISNKTRGG